MIQLSRSRLQGVRKPLKTFGLQKCRQSDFFCSLVLAIEQRMAGTPLATKLTTMATVKFTAALRRFFPGLKEMRTEGTTLREVLDEVETQYPRALSYLLDEQGTLRGHVNIFIDGNMITDRTGLSETFSGESEIYIIQALSGG